MQISNYSLGGKNVFVIAEIGNNHNGSVELALEMVDAAHEAGANCVKFQMRNMASVYRKKSLAKIEITWIPCLLGRCSKFL